MTTTINAKAAPFRIKMQTEQTMIDAMAHVHEYGRFRFPFANGYITIANSRKRIALSYTDLEADDSALIIAQGANSLTNAQMWDRLDEFCTRAISFFTDRSVA